MKYHLIGLVMAALGGFAAPSFAGEREDAASEEAAEESDDPFVKEVYSRVALEQYGRYAIAFTPEEAGQQAVGLGVELNPAQARNFQQRLFYSLMDVDAGNTAFLKQELAMRNGMWWTISEVGRDVSDKVWLMVQHADADRDFQREALSLMEPLVEQGEIQGASVAYLSDRIASAANRPQRFGTQGSCRPGRPWEANEIEAPADEVDLRRRAYGIDLPFADYQVQMDRICGEGH
ncbi:hypothetical protein K1X12_01920 [Hyphomonas sp. WL0036]|uniref:DUF6624 domain-containing protein n=1 Tax=Hyphomonas sediminis TaxID=2866160 RepID=UPI001C7F7364|nr:DUF6624 domain-containing protein [Hyphomonas sediminis]MBY9065636.1 hypothetical protein [Hyphomonas sediminis]